jgi:hypothetical protein
VHRSIIRPAKRWDFHFDFYLPSCLWIEMEVWESLPGC